MSLKVAKKEQRLRKKAAERSQAREKDDLGALSHGQLMKLRFFRNRLAVFGMVVLIVIYFIAAVCEFLSPYEPNKVVTDRINLPPQSIHIMGPNGLQAPFVYGLTESYHETTFKLQYEEDTEVLYPIRFFVKGDPYKMWGLIETDIHLFGTDEGGDLHLFGTDRLGRDIFSRCLYGARVSCTLGFVGVIASFLLGLILGGISGYMGGAVDNVIQRVIEFIMSLPLLPIWMALAAAIPSDWSVMQTYVAILLILALFSWTGLARVVRSKFISLKNEDFIRAARVSGASDMRIIMKHMVPMFSSHLIAQLALSVPSMILGETSLSFLGIGLRPPAISWGILLSEAQNIRNIALYPWNLIPGIFIVLTVMSFNFLGDGLRDAFDPNS